MSLIAGAGNGSLALAALKLGASFVHLVDYDSKSLLSAKMVLELNGYREGKDFQLHQGDLRDNGFIHSVGHSARIMAKEQGKDLNLFSNIGLWGNYSVSNLDSLKIIKAAGGDIRFVFLGGYNYQDLELNFVGVSQDRQALERMQMNTKSVVWHSDEHHLPLLLVGEASNRAQLEGHQLASPAMRTISYQLPRDFGPNEQAVLAKGYGIKKPIWMLTNEQGREEALRQLSSYPLPDTKAVHIGFSGMINLDIIAERRSGYAIIGDVNDNVLKYYDIIRQTVQSQRFNALLGEQRRIKFVQLLIEAFKNEGMFDLDQEVHKSQRMQQIHDLLTDSVSWLSSDKNFEYICNMFKENRIKILPLDVHDRQKFIMIGNWLKRNDLHIDTIYTSNIYRSLGELSQAELFGGRYGGADLKKSYWDDLVLVANKSTFLIDVKVLTQGNILQIRKFSEISGMERQLMLQNHKVLKTSSVVSLNSFRSGTEINRIKEQIFEIAQQIHDAEHTLYPISEEIWREVRFKDNVGLSKVYLDPQGNVSGFVLAYPNNQFRLTIYKIAVVKNSRRQGIGKLLLNSLAQNASLAGITTIGLSALKTNQIARKAYEVMGFHHLTNDNDSRRFFLDFEGQTDDVLRATQDLVMLDNTPGGIDLTASKLNVEIKNEIASPSARNDRDKRDGNDTAEGIKFHLDPAMLQQLQNAPGVFPEIINIQPLPAGEAGIRDLRLFLGVTSR